MLPEVVASRMSVLQLAVSAARAVLTFLDARDLVALQCTSSPSTSPPGESALLRIAREGVAEHARRRVEASLEVAQSGTAAPDLAATRSGSCSWLEALDEIESWLHMRDALLDEPQQGSWPRGAPGGGGGAAGAAALLLPSCAELSRAFARLRRADDLSEYTFPHRSL